MLRSYQFLSIISVLFVLNVFLPQFDVKADESPVQTCRLVINVSSQNVRYEAYKACDGNPETFWHSHFEGTLEPCPHWIEMDLLQSMTVEGIVYTPRPDMPNGTFEDVEIRVYESPENKGEPIWKGKLATQYVKPVQSIRITFEKPIKGRYVRLDVSKSLDGVQYASVAELQPIVTGKTFIERSFIPYYSNPNADPELVAQYNRIVDELKRRNRYTRIQDELYDAQAGILPEDVTPSDVIYRRTMAAAKRLEAKGDKGTRDLGLGIREDLKSFQSLVPSPQSLNSLLASPLATRNSQLATNDDFARFEQIAKIRREILFSNPDLDFDKIIFIKKHRGTYSHLCDQYYGRTLVPGGGVFMLENAFSEKATVKSIVENSCELRVASCENVLPHDSATDIQSVNNEERLAKSRNSQLATRNSTNHPHPTSQGAFTTLALNYEADTIAFAYTACTGPTDHFAHLNNSSGHWYEGRCLHIFTANLDGSNLKQITEGTWNDFYPCFLPNGRMAFVSERRGGYLRCGRECPNFTIFDMNPDGTQMRCLSYHETNEWSPSVSNDGKIIWTRWDYIDRDGCTTHCPWIMTLNGSDPRQIVANFTPRKQRPDTEMDVKAIPNSSKLVATGGPHHGHNYGSLVIIDPSQAPQEETNPMAAMKRLTPDVDFPETQGGAQVWGFPYPISEDLFLAVADYSMPPEQGMEWQQYKKGNYGIYLIDRFGNQELLYRDPEIGCQCPIPVRKRKKPVVMPALGEGDSCELRVASCEKDGSRENIQSLVPSPQSLVSPLASKYVPTAPRDWKDRPMATVTLANVYQSLKPLPEGVKIKSLRIVQLFPCTIPSGRWVHTGYEEPSTHPGWGRVQSINLVRGVIGTVPVEEDGSAHFVVPAQMEVFFQALDEKGQAVQSMRSGTYFQPGDNVSCVGCHEPKGQITKSEAKLPMALKRPASVPQCDIPAARVANFPELVQPILDKHCVACHAKPESKTFSLAKEPYAFRYNRPFYQSYDNLMKNGFGFYNYGNPLITIPNQFGARKSKLLPLLDGDHYGVKLTAEERERIVIWLDMLSPFYSVYDEPQQAKQLKGHPVYPTLE